MCGCKTVFVLACVHVCVSPQQAPQCSLPVGSINAQPCPRLICHSCCIFAFILICTSPLNWLSICPSHCSNLIVFVHYRWASNKADTRTHTHTHTHARIPLPIADTSSFLWKPPPNHTPNSNSSLRGDERRIQVFLSLGVTNFAFELKLHRRAAR